MQFPAQPKPRLALHETMQSRAQCPSLPRSTVEIHASPTLPIISLPKRISKHPNEMGLVCVKTRAEQEPELGIFGADDARIEDFERALRCIPEFMWPIFLWEMRWPGWLARDRLNEGLWLTSN